MSNLVNQKNAYSKFTDFKKISYNVFSYIMENNEDIWKLLYYNTPDAWEQSPLTMSQKRGLMYQGQPDETLYRCFIDEGQPDAWTHEACVLRIFPYAVFPQNRTVNTYTIVFDILCHYHINTMSNYSTRVDSINEEIIKLLNGTDIGIGLGVLFFDASVAKENRLYPTGQIPFKGTRLTMSINQN